MPNKLTPVLVAGAVLASATMAFANNAKSTEDFIKHASIANQFEIESSKLALNRSSDADVKSFAQKMVDDHTKTGQKMKSVLLTNGLKAPAPGLDDKHAKILKELKEASAKDFDEEYVDAQEDAHDDAVSLFKGYANNGENVALKNFAAETLPDLENHDKQVEALEEKF